MYTVFRVCIIIITENKIPTKRFRKQKERVEEFCKQLWYIHAVMHTIIIIIISHESTI